MPQYRSPLMPTDFPFLHLIKCFHIRLQHEIISAAFLFAVMFEQCVTQGVEVLSLVLGAEQELRELTDVFLLKRFFRFVAVPDDQYTIIQELFFFAPVLLFLQKGLPCGPGRLKAGQRT